MLKLELKQTDKHSTNICSGGKISDFYVAQILIQNRWQLCGGKFLHFSKFDK